jgi:transposase
MDAHKVVCIDESAANERTGTRKYGWSLKGAPCYTDEPAKRSKRWSILPALSVNGYLPGTLIYQGSITEEIFLDWLELEILPQLDPGTILVMDNASIHRTVAVRELIESYQCTVAFLPPYLPNFNPIELSFSVLKAWIRRYMGDATQYDDFKDFLQLAVDSLDGEMAVRWFWKCGYRTGL